MRRCVYSIHILIFLAFSSGCYPFRKGHTYYPPGAINLPTGTTTRQWQSAQADKSQNDGVVLYEASWIDGSDQLGPAAFNRLTSACSGDCEPLSFVTLEPSPDGSLNARRVQTILDLANNCGIALSPESIVLAHPDGNVLYGEESAQITREMMQGNRRSGNRNVFGAGTGGLFGGSQPGGFQGILGGGP